MPNTPGRPRASRAVLGILFVLIPALLSGCLRYTESVTIAPDDTVSGIIIIGARKQGSSGDAPMPSPQPGQQLPAPTSTTSRIVVAPFEHDQESGYKVTFRGATFEEVSQFAPLGEKGGALQLTREGNDILVSMTIDLTYAVPSDQIGYYQDNAKATVQLTVPGTIISSDGQVDGQTVSWELQPLELNTLEARIESAPGAQTVETSRSIDPVRAAIIAAILIGLLLIGWFLARQRLRPLLSSGSPGPIAAPVGAPPATPSRPARTGAIDAPDPFGEHASTRSRTQPEPTASRVPERTRAPSPVQSVAGGGWPPPQPRWREER